jgi:melibiase-like protein
MAKTAAVLRLPNRTRLLFTLAMTTSALFVFAPGPSRASVIVTTGDAYVNVEGNAVQIGNALIERSFDATAGAYGTVEVLDKVRPGNRWEGAGDFPVSPSLLPAVVGWKLTERKASLLPDGVEVLLRLEAPGLTVERTARVLDGVAAVRMQTTLLPATPLVLTEYSLERLRAASPYDQASYEARAIGFNGGSDWHDFDYRRDTVGATIDAEAEWLDVQGPKNSDEGGALAMLMERRNYHSSRMEWTAAGEAVARVDFDYDLLYTGPIEASAGPVEPGSVRNPAPASGRGRVVAPGGRLALEPVIVALGADKEEAAWHAHQMLASDAKPYTNTFNFNTDKTHEPTVDVGARDGVNFSVFQRLLPIAKALGVETFVFDDGWQRYNGDWSPDPARYNVADGHGFGEVKRLVEDAGMRMGLWMAPGAFHPEGSTFRAHPEWACVPTGAATGAANALDPNGDRFLGGSAAPGIGLWNLEATGPAGAYKDKLRADIDSLVEVYNVAEFKFDFLVWVDCVNPKPATIYDYHDAFFSTIDSLAMDHPGVGFGVDETNDYRSFPFESILRGPSWFQNGQPNPDELLHNVWSLAPFVPGRAIGQSVTIHPPAESQPIPTEEIDERMAVSLAYHPTFWTDIRELEPRPDIVAHVAGWTALFKDHRDLSEFAYPLLNDPLGGGKWSGLQPWNAEKNTGYAMLYRFGASNDTQLVPLRRIPPGMTFSLTEIRPGQPDMLLGMVTSAELTAGISVTIGAPHGARIIQIKPV